MLGRLQSEINAGARRLQGRTPRVRPKDDRRSMRRRQCNAPKGVRRKSGGEARAWPQRVLNDAGGFRDGDGSNVTPRIAAADGFWTQSRYVLDTPGRALPLLAFLLDRAVEWLQGLVSD